MKPLRRPLPIALSGLLLLVACLVPLARAETAPFRIEARDLEVLPVHDRDWMLLLRDHPRAMGELMRLVEHIEKVHRRFEERPSKDDAGARALIAEIERSTARFSDGLLALGPSLEALGIDETVLRSSRLAPRGALRPLRTALRLVRHAPGVDVRLRALHAALMPAVEGALLALESERRRADARGDGDGAARLAGRMREVERRTWRVVDATLDAPARAWLRRRLPNEIAKVPDLVGHLFVLPGLDGSQIQRLRSLWVGLEASMAPDQAVIAREERRPSPDGARRRREAERHLAGRVADAWEEGMAILDARQRAALEALPPRLGAAERADDLASVLDAAVLSPAQREQARALHRRTGPVKGRLVEKVVALALRMEGEAPDSPAHQAAEAARLRAYAEALAAGRRAASEVFRDLLEADQILAWVLADRAPEGD